MADRVVPGNAGRGRAVASSRYIPEPSGVRVFCHPNSSLDGAEAPEELLHLIGLASEIADPFRCLSHVTPTQDGLDEGNIRRRDGNPPDWPLRGAQRSTRVLPR